MDSAVLLEYVRLFYCAVLLQKSILLFVPERWDDGDVIVCWYVFSVRLSICLVMLSCSPFREARKVGTAPLHVALREQQTRFYEDAWLTQRSIPFHFLVFFFVRTEGTNYIQFSTRLCGARGSVDGWVALLQPGRSPVRYPRR
jgi:hypothetical protein